MIPIMPEFQIQLASMWIATAGDALVGAVHEELACPAGVDTNDQDGVEVQQLAER